MKLPALLACATAIGLSAVGVAALRPSEVGRWTDGIAAAAPGAHGRITFVTDRDGGDYEVYAMAPDGSGQVRLTSSPGFDRTPSWSPDGARIVFDRGAPTIGIHVMNADGSGVTRITTTADFNPEFSPDGARIAFESLRDGNTEIYVMNADGSGQTRLTTDPAQDGFPSWTPDGAHIVFATDGGDPSNWSVWIMDATGANRRRLTPPGLKGWDPKVSPDGRIAFTAFRPNQRVSVMDADGSNVRVITDRFVHSSDPAWSPDGRALAFTAATSDPVRDSREIYTVNADGSDLRRRTVNDALDVWADWQPGVNTPPVAGADAATADAATRVATVGVLANDSDADGDALVLTAFTRAAHGTASCLPAGQCVYTPDFGYSGPDAFTYTVSDGLGGTVTGTVTVTVEAGGGSTGGGAAVRRVQGRPVLTVRRLGDGVVVRRLSLVGVTAGARIDVRCAGACPPRTARLSTTRARDVGTRFAGRRLGPGARITITISKPGLLGRVFTFRVTGGRLVRTECGVTATGRLAACTRR